MKVGEFARRARASRMSKKAMFEAAFEKAKRDLRMLDEATGITSEAASLPKQQNSNGVLRS